MRPATIAIAGLVLGLGALWIYAWFLAPRGNVDRFDDQAWIDQAEQICAATRTEWLALPGASTFEGVEPRAEALRQRAAVMAQVTALLDGQVADLRATPPTDEKGREGVALWLSDWDGYLDSRRVQADRLLAGEDPPFAVQEQGGAPVTLRMDAFAKTNGMPSCIVPDDIG